MDDDTQNTVEIDGGHQRQLMEAFDFNEAELEANRAGRATSNQVQRLRDRRSTVLLFTVLLPVVTLAGAVIVFSNAGGQTYERGILVLLLISIAIGFLLTGNANRKTLTKAINAPVISSIEGTIQLERSYTRHRLNFDPHRFYLNVNYVRVEISYEQYAALQDGAAYRFYYLDAAPNILTVERLPQS